MTGYRGHRLEEIRRRIAALENRLLAGPDCRWQLLELIREAVPYDAACCTAVDPHTLLSVGATTDEEIETLHGELFVQEYGEQADVNRYACLAQASAPAAGLAGATGGRPELSARYRQILRPAGYGDELRCALMLHGACWGFLTLFRRRNKPPFGEQELAAAAALAPAMAAVLRRSSVGAYAAQLAAQGAAAQDLAAQAPAAAQAAPPMNPAPRAGAPGLTASQLGCRAPQAVDSPTATAQTGRKQARPTHGLLLYSEELTLLSADEAGERLLTELSRREGLSSQLLPRPVRAVCTVALSTEGYNPHQTKVSLAAPDGSLLMLRSVLMTGAGGGRLAAVCFEPASAADRLELAGTIFGLTPRELELCEYVLQGYSTKELARMLCISSYTVQDHLKAVFQKTGASSRRELTGFLAHI